MDIEDLAKEQDLDILDDHGDPVTEQFLSNMELYRKRDPAASHGIVWRWIIAYDNNLDDLSLMVQALPCNLSKIKSTASLREDHAKGIMVLTLPITYESFSNKPGPIPIFFSSDLAVTKEELLSTPGLAKRYMQILASRLLRAGEITR